LGQPTVTVQGYVSDPASQGYVNGRLATVNPDESWTAGDVPVSRTGMAVFDVEVSGTTTGSQRFTQPQPSQVLVTSFQENTQDQQLTSGNTYAPQFQSITRIVMWELGVGGLISQHSEDSFRNQSCDAQVALATNWNGTGLTGESCAGSYSESLHPAWQSAAIFNQADVDSYRGDYAPITVASQLNHVVQTRIALKARDNATNGALQLILLKTSAAEYSTFDVGHVAPLPAAYPFTPFDDGGDIPLPATALHILGQTPTPSATNANVGELLVAMQPGAQQDITPDIVYGLNQNHCSFDVQATDVNLQLEWTNQTDNFPIEDNHNPITGVPLPGGGKRIFVGAKTPTENNARNTVLLKARLSAPVPNVRIYFRAFDVDDPTPEASDPDGIVDSNGKAGNDNAGPDYVTAIFPASATRDIYADTDTNGEATVEFQVGLQPGNNYRVAATWDEHLLNGLSVDYPQSDLYVPADDSQIPKFSGTLSPMLTVWRKLHIEVDSMAAVAASGTQANFQTGTIAAYEENSPVAGQSKIYMSTSTVFNGVDNQCENGRLEIAGFAPLKIVSNIYGTVETFIVEGAPGTNVIGRSFKIYDDDDRFLDTLGLPPALPKDDESTNIIAGIRAVFFPAYIDVTNANAEGLNPNKEIPFQSNAEMGVSGSGVYGDAKDLHDSPNFWAHTVTFGYQPASSEDEDPNSEGPLVGITLKKSFLFEGGVSAIFIEAIRDASIDNSAENHINDTDLYPDIRTDYWENIEGIVAHEIGHAPGGNSASSDHDEGGLMQTGGDTIKSHHFVPVTIKRFRNANQWSQ